MEYVIGVDLGGTQLRAALVSAHGEILAQQRVPSLVAEGPAAVVARIAALVGRVSVALPPDAALLGLGLGSPGPLDPHAGMVFAPPNLPGWRDVPLRDMVAAATGLPVELGNDADAAAVGEHRFGGGAGCQHLVYVTVSTGIGGGVIADGRLMRGRRGIGGELGYLVLDAAAGTFWEDLASGTALGRAAAMAMPEHPGSALHALATPATVTAAHVARAAAAGDGLAGELMEREAHYLGMGFASILHIFSPEVVLVGGSVATANPALLERAAAIAHARVIDDLYRAAPILPATLGDNAGVLGAAALLLAARAPAGP